MVMDYTDFQVISTAAGLNTFGSAITYQLNSVYRPCTSSGTRDPFGYGTFSGVYSKYRVTKCELKIRFYDPSLDGIVVVAHIKSQQDAYTNAGLLLVNVLDKPATEARYVSSTGAQQVVLQKMINIGEIEGVSRAELIGDANYAAGPIARPSFGDNLEIVTCNVSTAAAITVVCEIRMRLHVNWFALQTLAES